MRITLDATPLLGPRTGIGRYTTHLLAELPGALARAGVVADLRVSTWTLRGGRVPALPPGIRQVGYRVPARALRAAWRVAPFPPAEALVGRTDVFHGVNFVVPPAWRAAEVVTVHDLTYEEHTDTVSPADLAYRGLVRRAVGRGAHVLTPSAHVAGQVRDFYGLAESQVTATPLGVDPGWSLASPPTERWLADHGLTGDYVVFVGSLGPRKNLRRLVEAFGRVRSGGLTLALAGPAGRAADVGGGPHVVPTGWLGEGELRSLVAGARALVLPSLDEGFGLPVLEALAAGRPVLASEIPVLREVAGTHAVFANPLDVAALAEGLRAVLELPDDEEARAGRRAWAARFTWASTADLTARAYREIAR
ncbi:glycosyl transferase [Cellulomonas chitinilytica]|uniref:Glycosyl transferase n=1 Tax=Cellulomonas chitinilytica TaxID=398759 RepID=A0A919NYU9_9CELL|nr:glycosyltransferase family 1 protein [Cellulomonas chitinilytica]GIG20186.1 glycosyl transferase [Cellulomonas chitinilytica]